MQVLINGELINEADAKVPIHTRGFLFGAGLFETLRAYDGQLPFLDRHLKRLEYGAVFLGIPLPHLRQLKDDLLRLLIANNLKEARLKLILTTQSPTFRPSAIHDDEPLQLVMVCEPFTALSRDLYQQGVDLKVIHSVRNDQPLIANLKSLSWITKIIARKEIEEEGCYDGILLDAHGHITETTTANLFWIKDGCVHTASTTLGVLPGVTREIVMEICEDQGIPIKETMIKEAELLQADEVFLTGSSIEVLAVSEIVGHKIGKGPGTLTQKIHSYYLAELEQALKDG